MDVKPTEEIKRSPSIVEAASPPPEQILQLPSPPDGGYLAWLQVASGFCTFFNTWGLLNSFGMHFVPMSLPD